MTLTTECYHYFRFSISPLCTDALTLRKAIEDALGQTFGATCAKSAVDVLWISENGDECVLRTAEADASRLLAAMATYDGSPRLTLIKESPFLPSLLSQGGL
ncbi:hypothetical protein BD626DRAFT_402960 [Schizophyllum amplum]|uniref:Ribonucleases P/MRP subunit Pop8-like domain-containing protein n=1 Tax=Schizophyllum amplum TaxID=97359 RepID=A0A550BRW8_9AGAR|nr:hypothetical protein BD626DRAFT_419056 [Auriculariopsis ampla]TRM63130.1 hypothetical protein BD626DRAFT_402960 [Auriculariopsis ampla]